MSSHICRGRFELQAIASRIATLLSHDEEWVITIEEVREGGSRFCGLPGVSGHYLYPTWNNMWERCTNPAHSSYRYYGGRGISVCEEWRDFVQFLIDVGERPSKNHSLDRIDGNGRYERGNVRWATKLEQSNNKRSNRFIEWRGEKKTLAEWARVVGLPYSALKLRLDRRGWSVDEALSTPISKSKGRPFGAKDRKKRVIKK